MPIFCFVEGTEESDLAPNWEKGGDAL